MSIDSTPRTHDVNSIDTVRVAIRGLERVGLDPEPELRRAGAALVDGKASDGLSRAAYCRLWARMSHVSGREDFGLMFADQVETGIVGPLEWLATTAPTVGAGLDVLARCGRLLHTGGHYALEVRGREAAFVYHPGSIAPSRVVIDWSFGYLLRVMRRVTAGEVAPKAISVQYARPAETASVEDALGACVSFDAPVNEIIFAREHLDVPLTTRDPEAHAMLTGLCRSRCASASADDLSRRVRAILLRGLAREELPSLREIARSMAMSERSLQRALTALNTSFRQLVLEARMEMAERWLADPCRSIGDIAYALGYSETSAFHRAYRNHFGKSCRVDAMSA